MTRAFFAHELERDSETAQQVALYALHMMGPMRRQNVYSYMRNRNFLSFEIASALTVIVLDGRATVCDDVFRVTVGSTPSFPGYAAFTVKKPSLSRRFWRWAKALVA